MNEDPKTSPPEGSAAAGASGGWFVRAAVVGLIVAALALVGLALYDQRGPARGAGNVLGLPAFPLRELSGGTVSPSSFQGHPLFINMWASWCPPCRAEMPDLQHLYEANKGSGFLIIGDDQGENEDAARRIVTEIGVTYPILLDPDERIARQFGTEGLPMTLVFNRKGQLVDVVAGMMTAPIMRAELRKALAQ